MRSTLVALLLSLFAFDARAVAAIAGTGTLQGSVQAAPALGQLTVYAYDAERRIGYMVFVVDGRYRATNLFPGKYTVTLRGTPGQRSWSLPTRSSNTRIAPGKTAQVDFVVNDTALASTYVGGMTYADAAIASYDEIYPPGEARQVLERHVGRRRRAGRRQRH
ncbi:MAG: carboxypeptidase regulatory-like domain-containing protein [Gammaproteobacteria bacterium]|nr:carboxypeptidase regulatory-like domain-containing protein [Gammaproteobacteria bacterium]